MLSKIDTLLNTYDNVLNESWLNTLSGQERVWFLVYDPVDQRKIDLRIGDFERFTKKAGKNWIEIDLKMCFPDWMSKHEYKEEYFTNPEDIKDQIEVDFLDYVTKFISGYFLKEVNENNVFAIRNISSIFGFLKLSDVLSKLYNSFKGRLLIFFPGEFDKNHYRLMDARDGWNYLARPITG